MTEPESESDLAWIGETFASDTGWDHLERLVDAGSRMAGSDGERRGAAATRDALSAVGAREAHLEEFEIRGWTRGSSAVRVGGESVAPDASALPRSPAGEATGRLVDVGHGLPSEFDRDLSGAVVMAASDVPAWHDRFVHRREKYSHAVAAGAAGFVFRNHVEGRLAPTGSVGTPAELGQIPAVGVSKEDGARLSRRFAGESVTVAVEATTGPATSQNVHADLGPDTDEALLLTSHVDAHDVAEGALDNGAGTALVVEVARALATRARELETRVHVVCFGAEEVGLLGSSHDAERRGSAPADATGGLDAVRAVVNCDGVVAARTLSLATHGFDGLDRAADRVASRLGHPVSRTPELMPHSDHWPYVARGVPGVHAASDTGEAGRGWGHTRADTLDKLERRTLREQAILVTELVVDLAREERTLSRRPPAEVAAQAEREDRAEGLRVTGDWPF